MSHVENAVFHHQRAWGMSERSACILFQCVLQQSGHTTFSFLHYAPCKSRLHSLRVQYFLLGIKISKWDPIIMGSHLDFLIHTLTMGSGSAAGISVRLCNGPWNIGRSVTHLAHTDWSKPHPRRRHRDSFPETVTTAWGVVLVASSPHERQERNPALPDVLCVFLGGSTLPLRWSYFLVSDSAHRQYTVNKIFALPLHPFWDSSKGSPERRWCSYQLVLHYNKHLRI